MARKGKSGGCGTFLIIFIIIGIATTYWPAILIILGIALIITLVKRSKLKKSPLANIDFDSMDGHQFEHFCAKVLRANGFQNVNVTQGSGDHGIDVLASKDGNTYAIQCKCYSNNVGNKAVQEAYSGKGIYRSDIAAVMTNRYFTEQAKYDAKKLRVELWDRNKLMYFIRQAKEQDESAGKLESNNYNKSISLNGSVSPIHDQPKTMSKAKRLIIQEEKLSNQRENFDNAIEEFKKKKEEKTVYDKERGIYPAGEYTIGEDIPTGRYLFKSRDKEYGYLEVCSSYQQYLEHDHISYEGFKGDYFATIRENGQFIIVKNADFQKMDY